MKNTDQELVKEIIKLTAQRDTLFGIFLGMYRTRGGSLEHFFHKVVPADFQRALTKLYTDDKRRIKTEPALKAFEEMWTEIRAEIRAEI